MENAKADSTASEIQRLYGGRYIAQIDGKVVANAATYQELSQQLDRMGAIWTNLVIEYVEPATSVSVY